MSDIKPVGIDTTAGSSKAVNTNADRLMVNNISSIGSIIIEPEAGTSEYVLLYPGDATATQAAGFTDIRGGNGYTGIQASDVYIYGGAANGSTGMAGVINIDGGFGNATAGGGVVTVGGGACNGANLAGGNVTIFGGSNNTGPAGDVGIIGGFSNAPADQGSVLIGATYTSAVLIGSTGITTTIQSGTINIGSGGTAAPGGIEIYPAQGNANRYVYVFGGDANLTSPGGEAQMSGGDGFTGMAAGDTYVYAGNLLAGIGGTAPGNVYIFSGYGRTFASGGALEIDGGQTDQVAGFGGNVHIRGGLNSATPANHGELSLGAANTRSILMGNTGMAIGFYGSTSVSRPTVTGSRGGNAALASFLTSMASLGLIIDGTSA